MFIVKESDRSSFLAVLEGKNNRYDEMWKCPTDKLQAANYHTRLAFCDVHSTREAFIYAASLLMTGEEGDKDRACEVLRHVCALQDKDPASKTYGIWSWYMEEPLDKMAPPDWNWADFCGKEILQVMLHHKERIPHDLYLELEDSLCHACGSIFRRNVNWDYTNIAIMGAYVTIIGGQVLNWPWMHQYGKRRFKRFVEATRDNGTFAEYNSATYTVVAIEDLTRLRTDAKDPEIVEMADEMLDMAWRTVAEHFHAPTKQWCGPNARSYTWLIGKSTLSFLEHCLHHKVKLAGEDFAYSTGWAYLELDCPEKYRYAFEKCIPHETVQTFTTGPDINSPKNSTATLYMEQAYAMSSWNVSSTWNQRRNLLSFWGGSHPRYINATILHDLYDFSSGMYVTAQKGGHAVTIASLVSDGGDTHCNLDMIQNETIRAHDLRIRLELGGEYEEEWKINGDLATLRDGGLNIQVKLLGASFDGEERHLVKTTTEEDAAVILTKSDLHRRIPDGERRSYLDVVFYSGEEREIHLNELRDAYAAFTISMDGYETNDTGVNTEGEQVTASFGELYVSATKRPVKRENWQYTTKVK